MDKRNTFVSKTLIIGIIVLFIGVGVQPAFAAMQNNSIPISYGKTLYVGGTGPGNYTKIQDAINDASDGDTVFVYNGTYNEYELDVDKSISLIGENKYSTIIDGQGKNYVIDFQASWITLSGFTIQNTEEGASVSIIIVSNHWGPETNYNTITNNIFNDSSMNALFMYSTNHNTITNNIVMNCGWFLNSGFGIECGAPHQDNIFANNTLIGNSIFIWGVPKNDIIMNNHIIDSWILIDGGENNIVENNIIENGTNIFIDESANNVVENNVFISSEAIIIRESTQIKVYNNTFVNSHGISINGDSIDYWDTHIIEYNEINGKPIYYYSRKQGITVPKDASQVILSNCKNCYIENFTFAFGWGIQIGFSSNNMICNNEILGSLESGILLQDSSQNFISKNILSDNINNGIELKGMSIENNISKNIIKNNGFDGISISEGSSGNNIYLNIIQGEHEDGIILKSDYNIILTNSIVDCIDCGIYCTGSNNSILENHIAGNSIGLWLLFGNFNKIIRNNFLDNINLSVFFSVVYRFEFSNKWIKNYYDDSGSRLIKIIWGRIQTRFGFWWEDIWGYRYWRWIYRPGVNIDWHPAKEPYDIKV